AAIAAGRTHRSHAGGKADRSSCFNVADPIWRMVVLRVLDRSAVNMELESLGFPKHVFDYVVQTVQQPNGIFINTGPTGCGKTTTLYSCLKRINTIDSKLLTVEDPVEYDIDGIMQVPVNEAVGMTFPRALRAFL